MKSEIYLKNKANECYSKWDDNIDFNKLNPTAKVISLLEVWGQLICGALSFHYEYLAVVGSSTEGTETLYIIYLREKRIEALKLPNVHVSTISFAPLHGHSCVVIGLANGELAYYLFELKSYKTFDGKHNGAVAGISYKQGSEFLITWTSRELLLWAWPTKSLSKRLKVDSLSTLINAAVIPQKNYIVALFESGALLAWDLKQNMKEHVIEPPEGVTFKFESFSISSDGEWVIGSGGDAMIVVYSLNTFKVSQLFHLAHPDSLLGIHQIQFLPYIQPEFPQTYIVRTSRSILVVDFVNSSIVKSLKSHNYSLDSFFTSGDGFLLGVLYSNGCCKLYTLPSFFPSQSCKKELRSDLPPFKVIDASKSTESTENVKAFLEETKWLDLLEEFREFPSDYRKYIWATLLKLPKNYSLFNDLLLKSRRNPIELPSVKISGMPDTVLGDLKSVLECLQFWAPFLSSVEFLPQFLVGFVHVFQNNLLISFEISAYVLLNFCRGWFMNWPLPPQDILKRVDQVIREEDVQLHSHLKSIELSPEVYCWRPLSTGFSEVLSSDDWRVAWDHILTNDPSFMLDICAAITLSLRGTLLKCSESKSAEDLYSQTTWIPVRSILKKARLLYSSRSSQISKRDAVLLPKGALPPFDIGPSSGRTQKCLSSIYKNQETPYCLTKAPNDTKVSFSRPDEVIGIRRKVEESPKFEIQSVSDRDGLDTLEKICVDRVMGVRRKMLHLPQMTNR